MSRGEYKDKTPAEYRHDYYIAHREYFRARDRERRRDTAEFVDSQKLGKQCAMCGQDDVTKLIFHHRDPATKLFSVGSANRSIKAIVEETAKCVLWCKKCHNKYHHTKTP